MNHNLSLFNEVLALNPMEIVESFEKVPSDFWPEGCFIRDSHSHIL